MTRKRSPEPAPPPAPPGAVPYLASYDIILASISGGKDSQTMLRALTRACAHQGVPPARVVTVFADLGEDDEWPGTRELAAHHAACYGLRFITVARTVPDGRGGTRPQGLAEHIAQRGRWPDARNRYCTSDMKRGPIRTVMTRLATEQREAGVTGRPVRLLHVLGLRAQESPARRLLAPFGHDPGASNLTRRQVDQWLPIHHWATSQVWADIHASGIPYHYAYDLGMPRLSCVFCVLASESALVLAAQQFPERAARRAQLEQRMGHTFQNGRSMAQIIAKAQASLRQHTARDWSA